MAPAVTVSREAAGPVRPWNAVGRGRYVGLMHLPALLLLLQVVTPPDSGTGAPRAAHFDSLAAVRAPSYASAALAALLDSASRNNRRVPPALQGYRARVESEMALIYKRAEGQEVAASLEQAASRVTWRRTGEYEQHVEGYRATQLSLSTTVIGMMRDAWTVPVLYGNRMVLLFGADTSRRTGRSRTRARRRVHFAEHPLGEERDRFYTFAGGDTVARVRMQGRMVELVRVRVTPRTGFAKRVVVFSGDLDLDARRLQLVRMRGRFLEAGPPPPRRGLPNPIVAAAEPLAFLELENQEVNGAWWLPAMQRIEMQVSFPQLGDARSVLRIVSRWREYDVDATGDAERLAAAARSDTAGRPDPALAAAGDTMQVRAHRLTMATADSLSTHRGWNAELGTETAATRTEDFVDVAPDRWRPTGPPRLDWRVTRVADLAHFNRVEGVYTGYGVELRLRDRAPGVAARANAGWAWGDEAVRGRAQVERARGAWIAGVRGGRAADLTNDFRSALDSGSTVAALLGEDAYDYVERRSAAVFAARRLTARVDRPVVARVEAGWGRDAPMANAIARGPVGDRRFRENRGALEGSYGRAAAQLELDPDMAAEALRPGMGALLHAELARGEVDWARIEARLLVRRQRGDAMVMARGDAGVLLADRPPPQQLFELGGSVLSGYEYKEFAGDRAALGRVLAMYTFPVLRAPVRLSRGLALPGLSPGVSVGWQSGWASVGGREASADAVRMLGIDEAGVPVSRPTDGVRSSYDVRLRLFGGAASAGAARAVERGSRWRFVFGITQEL